jgi:signal transduction histidine kinase
MVVWALSFIAAVGVGVTCFIWGMHLAARRCHEVEEELLVSEANIRIILKSIPDLICRLREDGTYLDLKGNEMELELSTGRFIGNNDRNFLPPPQTEDTLACIEKAIKTQEIQVMEYWLPTHDDHVQDIEARIAPYGKNEVLVILRNITEQVHMRKLLVQTEKMMTIGGLAAGMAHEINNPLGGIMQGAQIILQRIDPKLKKNRDAAEALDLDLEKMKTYLQNRKVIASLDIIRESGNRAAKTVNNMLKFTRKGETDKSSLNINQLIENTIELASKDYDLKRNYDFRNIILKKDFCHDLPEVTCAESEIQQVAFNLLKNASQAMTDNKQIKGVHQDYKPEINIQTRLEESHVVIKISDNGPGIPQETQSHLFEPFYTTKKTGSGTGLGLFVSYYILVNNHNGSITVESSEGEGATFTIKLPVNGHKQSSNEV